MTISKKSQLIFFYGISFLFIFFAGTSYLVPYHWGAWKMYTGFAIKICRAYDASASDPRTYKIFEQGDSIDLLRKKLCEGSHDKSTYHLECPRQGHWLQLAQNLECTQ